MSGGNAIPGFGHIARIHGLLNESTVKPVIEAALRDESEYVRGQANSAANDVAFFLNESKMSLSNKGAPNKHLKATNSDGLYVSVFPLFRSALGVLPR